MIVIDLSCAAGHSFEAWFPSAEAFNRQNEAGQVCCPQCANRSIRRVPSAAYIAKRLPTAACGTDTPKTAPHTQSLETAAAQGVSALKAVIDALLATSENVGRNFAQEARRIHYQDVPPRPVHGQATIAELNALTEEGIAVLPIPCIAAEDLN